MGVYPPWFHVTEIGNHLYEERPPVPRERVLTPKEERDQFLYPSPAPPPPSNWERLNAPLKRLLPTYGWIFDPPQRNRIDITRLAVQWILVGLLIGVRIWTANEATLTTAPKGKET